jgi:type IV pilus assembly protein PilM
MLKQLVDRLTTVPLVGVDVGSSWVKVVQLAQVGDKIALHRAAAKPLDGATPVTLLKRLVIDAGITTSHAAIGLASPQLIVKTFQFPTMPRKELANAVRLEAEQAILNGHLIKDMALDWQAFPTKAKDAIRGLLSVVPKTIVAQRLDAAKAAGLKPAVVDVEGLALWNAYWALVGRAAPAPKTVMLINVGAHTTNLVIAKGPDALILVRDVQLGGQALSEGREHEWATEVQDSLGYARSQGGLRSLDAVYVTGGGSGPSLLPLLKPMVGVPLTFWNPLQQLVRDGHGPVIDESIGPLLAVAVGLALRQTA